MTAKIREIVKVWKLAGSISIVALTSTLATHIMIDGAAAQTAAEADSRIAKLCGPDQVNEAASEDDVRPNPAGFYVASLREQVSEGDPRIVLSNSDEFYLCTRQAATPDMDSSKALLLMHERTVKYLFVPVIRRDTRGSS